MCMDVNITKLGEKIHKKITKNSKIVLAFQNVSGFHIFSTCVFGSSFGFTLCKWY